MFRVIEDVKTNIHFSSHSVDRFDRKQLKQCKLDFEDILPIFEYHKSVDTDDSLVWAVQDYLKNGSSSIVIVIDKTFGISLVLNVYYDYVLDELNISIITIWDGKDIKIRFGQNIIHTK